MPSPRIPKNSNSGTYFLTFTIKNWYYILDRYFRWNILADSLKFFQKNRGLRIYGFVFMINHIHLLVSSDDAIGFVRDFKKYTTKMILYNIEQSEPHLIIGLFTEEDGSHKIWQDSNMPEKIESEKFFLQKLKYIVENPIKRYYVSNPEYWYWSSANRECELKTDEF